jgi:hypothetical protein
MRRIGRRDGFTLLSRGISQQRRKYFPRSLKGLTSVGDQLIVDQEGVAGSPIEKYRFVSHHASDALNLRAIGVSCVIKESALNERLEQSGLQPLCLARAQPRRLPRRNRLVKQMSLVKPDALSRHSMGLYDRLS